MNELCGDFGDIFAKTIKFPDLYTSTKFTEIEKGVVYEVESASNLCVKTPERQPIVLISGYNIKYDTKEYETN